MKEPLVPRRRKPNQPKKLKLVCSFNGSFQPRPPSGKLRYTGGETRILSVDRNINLTRLRSKISELFSLKPNNNGFYFSCFSLIYKLTAQDDDGRLVLITSDDGVYGMIDEYEKLIFQGKPTRLWIFVIKENEFVKYGNVKCGYGLFCEFCDGLIGGDRKENSVMSLSSHNTVNSNGVLRNHLCECKDSMRKIIPSNHLLEKEPARIRGFSGHSGLGVQETEKVYVNETLNHDQPLIDLNPEPESTARNEATYQQFGGDPYRASVLDYEFRSNQLNREINLGHSPLLVPNSHALYPMDGNLYGVTNFLRNPMVATAEFPEQSCGSLQGGIRSHRFASIEARNQRACPYYLRNYKNGFSEFGNYRNGRVEGRHWVGKFYPGVKSGSNIAKQGQTMRLHHSRLCKPWYGYHDYLPKGISGKENFADKSNFTPNLKQYQYSYNGTRNQSILSSYVTKIPLTSTRVMEKEEDRLTGPTSKKLEVPCQASCKSSQGVSLGSQRSPLDFEKESQHNTPNNSEKFFNIELCESLRKHPSCAHAIQGDIASLVDVSLRNLSLSSSKEVEPRASLSKPLDLMDEEQINSGPQVEISSGIESDSSSQKKTKLENVAEEMKPNQRDHKSTSRVDKKVEGKESHKCSKANGSIPCDLVTFYAHLARRELQTIQDSDLEYIKELGSGTYGTVFYGKWKGCDVAVKKLKSSCFVEGAPEQDRLIADFWKEAHTLGQLHHPHIVALYGVVTDGPVTNLATVTEYMVNGSLKQVLRKKDRTIDRRKRLIIAMDAAFGMEYLHEKNIVHFDLKSHNLLMNMRDPQRPVCKIGDLGLSKIKQRTLVSGGIRGTISWMAPELLNSGKTMVTEKVDVYSFGIIMWELLTGEEPYGNMRSHDIIAGIIKGNLRPEIPCWCDPAWRSLMEMCWSLDPNSRPAFPEIAKELRAMATAMNIK